MLEAIKLIWYLRPPQNLQFFCVCPGLFWPPISAAFPCLRWIRIPKLGREVLQSLEPPQQAQWNHLHHTLPCAAHSSFHLCVCALRETILNKLTPGAELAHPPSPCQVSALPSSALPWGCACAQTSSVQPLALWPCRLPPACAPTAKAAAGVWVPKTGAGRHTGLL